MIKPRTYSMALYKRTDEDYLPAIVEHIETRRVKLVPTVSQITGLINARYPDMEIDTRWETLRDLLQGARKFGYALFSVSLRRPGDPREINYSLSFLEV